MESLLQRVSDPNLGFSLGFGIGLHHAGLGDRDRKVVEELFFNQKIHVSVCSLVDTFKEDLHTVKRFLPAILCCQHPEEEGGGIISL